MANFYWDENKRQKTLIERGLDFADAHKVFDDDLKQTKEAKQMTIARKKEKLDKRRIASIAENDDIPPLDDSFWNNAQMGSPLRKRLISLRLDNDMVDWFKDQGPNYQTRMNQILRTYMDFCVREKYKQAM